MPPLPTGRARRPPALRPACSCRRRLPRCAAGARGGGGAIWVTGPSRTLGTRPRIASGLAEGWIFAHTPGVPIMQRRLSLLGLLLLRLTQLLISPTAHPLNGFLLQRLSWSGGDSRALHGGSVGTFQREIQFPLETPQPQITLDKVAPLLFQNAKCHTSEQEPRSLPHLIGLLSPLGSHLSQGTHHPLLQGEYSPSSLIPPLSSPIPSKPAHSMSKIPLVSLSFISSAHLSPGPLQESIVGSLCTPFTSYK